MLKTIFTFYVDLLNSENRNRFQAFVHILQDKRIYLCYNAQCKGESSAIGAPPLQWKVFFSPYRKENALW